jgi:hypothetical protein
MLQSMQQLADNPSSANSDTTSTSSAGHSFMGVLAGLTTPKTSAPASGSGRNDDGLEDDVTTLSYESALRNIARYKPTDASALNLPKDFDLASAASSLYGKLSAEKAKIAAEQESAEEVSIWNRNREARPATAPLPMPITPQSSASDPMSAPLPASTPMPEDAFFPAPAREKASSPLPSLAEARKRASVTIRLSEPEYEQLHQRAAEAGLTISAYLRSCTFEAEALRAQVKEALADLRADAKRESPAAQTPHKDSLRNRLARFRRSGITISV